MTIIPGFYMPPFYDGIPGWFYKANPSQESFSYFAIKNKKVTIFYFLMLFLILEIFLTERKDIMKQPISKKN